MNLTDSYGTGTGSEVGRALSSQAAVAELGHAALVGLEVAEVLDLAVDLACDVLEIDYGAILHQPSPGEPLVLVAARGWGDDAIVGETTIPCEAVWCDETPKSDPLTLVDDFAVGPLFAAAPSLIGNDVVSGTTVTIPDQDRAYGVLSVHSRAQRSFTADDGDFLRSLANIVGGAVQSDRSRRQNERRLRYEAALAECAQSLLASTGDNRLEKAVEALLSATRATYVVVERNVFHPELGLCCQIVADAEKPGTPDYGLGSDYWQLVSWDRMPTSRAELEKGKPFVLIPEELTGIEYETYAADPYPVKSELDIPIFVDGKWEGLIEFTDSEVARDWTDEDISLLNTAATMIGAFWEREAAAERLRQINREKDAFLASVSHELRTPLTTLVGFGQLLLDPRSKMSDEERADFLEMVVAQGTDLTNITNDLLAAAKADIGALEVTSVSVNLRAQSAQVLEAFEQGLVTDTELIGDCPPAAGDPDRVRQILRNLVSNALRYGGDNIRIELAGDAGGARVLVCDDGPPISEIDRERIFEPYQRAGNAPGIAESLGLGLSISRKLARLMGGDLTYRHEDGESVFELTLPLA